MDQNVKKVASKNLKKPKVAENSKSCQNSKKLPKISKVAEKLPSNLWLSLPTLHSPEVFQNAAFFLRTGVLYILISHENGAFRALQNSLQNALQDEGI